MADRHERERTSVLRIADRLMAIKFDVYTAARRLRHGEPVEAAAVAAHLARINQEVDAAVAALADLNPERAGRDLDGDEKRG